MMILVSTALAGGLEVEWTPQGAEEPLVVEFSGVQQGMPQKATWTLSKRHRYHLEVEVVDIDDGVAVIEAEIHEERDPILRDHSWTTVTEPVFRVRVGEEARIAVHDQNGEGYELALVLEDDGLIDAGDERTRTARRTRTSHRRTRTDERDRTPDAGL